MPSDLPQRKVRTFLNERLQSQETFTKQEFQQFTGWNNLSTFRTYWSKQIKPSSLRSQLAGSVSARATGRTRPGALPAPRHPGTARRGGLPEDGVRARHRLRVLHAADERGGAEEHARCHFGGYSIYHVDGRFLGGAMLSREEAAEREQTGQRYLVDETTAVTRFIFPCETDDESELVRYFFNELFVQTIIQLINAEDQIWMVESGMRNRVHIWRVDGSDDDGSYDENAVAPAEQEDADLLTDNDE